MTGCRRRQWKNSGAISKRTLLTTNGCNRIYVVRGDYKTSRVADLQIMEENDGRARNQTRGG